MIEGRTILELGSLAIAGAGLEVNGAQFTALELASLAMKLQPGATLRIVNSNRLSQLECNSIALAKPGQVSFS